jgi:hypothetical protein
MGVRPFPVRRFDDLAIANRPISETVAKVRCRSTEFNSPVDLSEAHPRITARSERARRRHPTGDARRKVSRSTRALQRDTGLRRAAAFRLSSGRAILGWRLPHKVAPLAYSWKPGVNIARSAGTSPRAGDLVASHGRLDEECTTKARAFAPSSLGGAGIEPASSTVRGPPSRAKTLFFTVSMFKNRKKCRRSQGFPDAFPDREIASYVRGEYPRGASDSE